MSAVERAEAGLEYWAGVPPSPPLLRVLGPLLDHREADQPRYGKKTLFNFQTGFLHP